MSSRFDKEILALIPHRPPMLLINQLLDLNASSAQARVLIDSDAPFFVDGLGVPAWIGLEYMGQTSALIAGYQEREGLCEKHLGFLMGARKYTSSVAYFSPQQALNVVCEEAALVGESLAIFRCTILLEKSNQVLATANLSVFRRPLDAEIENNEK